MTVDPIDGIVVIELTVDEARQVSQLIAAGAAAWAMLPAKGAVDAAFRPKDVASVVALADEIWNLAQETHDKQNAAFKAQAKRGRRA